MKLFSPDRDRLDLLGKKDQITPEMVRKLGQIARLSQDPAADFFFKRPVEEPQPGSSAEPAKTQRGNKPLTPGFAS